MVEVIFDSPKGRLSGIDQNIGGAPIPIVRKAHTSRIHDGLVRDPSDERKVYVAVNDGLRRNISEGAVEFRIGVVLSWRNPRAVRRRMAHVDFLYHPGDRQCLQSPHPGFAKHFGRDRTKLLNQDSAELLSHRKAPGQIVHNLGLPEHLIRVSENAFPSQINNPIEDFAWARAVGDKVPQMANKIRCAFPQVLDHRIQRSKVAMDVADEGDAHVYTCEQT
jgi:hypothetical protein